MADPPEPTESPDAVQSAVSPVEADALVVIGNRVMNSAIGYDVLKPAVEG